MSIESELKWLDEHPWADKTGLIRALLTGGLPQSPLVELLLPKRDKMKTKPKRKKETRELLKGTSFVNPPGPPPGEPSIVTASRKPLLCSKCGKKIK